MDVLYAPSGELGFDGCEFDFLSRYMANRQHAGSWAVDNLEGYIAHLSKIRKELRFYSIEKFSGRSESEYFGVAEVNAHSNSFKYTYQRYDLESSAENWLNKTYHICDDNFLSYGLFTMSGMSALLVSLLSIRHLYPKNAQIRMSRHGYFEINDMLSRSLNFFDKTYFDDQNVSDPDIVVLDSSAPALPHPDEWTGAHIIIIDTTCWELGSPILENLLVTLREHQGIVILVRSHIKLDCFGLEVNRLGSVIVLSSTNTPTKGHIEPEIFHKTCKEINGNIGCNFHLHDYYPWLLEKKFQVLAHRRTARIRHYTNLIGDVIAASQVTDCEIINKTQHGLFILVKLLRHKIKDPIVDYTKEICSLANRMGVALLPAPSFALCCTAFDGFRSKIDNEVYLRIAPSPNMSLGQAQKIADFFTDLLLNEGFYNANFGKKNCILHQCV